MIGPKISIYTDPSGHYVTCPFCDKRISIDILLDDSNRLIDMDGTCMACSFDFSVSIHTQYVKLYN